MGWNDLGLIFAVTAKRPWMTSHGYVPTAAVLPDRIRVFAAFWDDGSVGRIGYVDLALDDPMRVIRYSGEPALDVGPPGAFDEHGVTPMALCRADDGRLLLYYAGWQRTPTVRYLLFNGLAISADDGLTFERYSNVPIFERSNRHYLLRTGFVLRDGATWKAWCAQSDGLIDVNGKPTPTYSLGYMESQDGLRWPAGAEPCLPTGGDGVFGYGRSAIWRDGAVWHALLSVRRSDIGYRIEHATSRDGREWQVGVCPSMSFLPEHTVDAQAETMFPSVVKVDGRLLMFYNGDAFGRAGIRLAIWE